MKNKDFTRRKEEVKEQIKDRLKQRIKERKFLPTMKQIIKLIEVI